MKTARHTKPSFPSLKKRKIDVKNLVMREKGLNLSRLSENVFTRLVLYYMLINYFLVNNIWYVSAWSISFSDNLFQIDIDLQ